jgi:hypothetical protein
MQDEELEQQNAEGEMFQLEITEEQKQRLLDAVGEFLSLSASLQEHILNTNDSENPRIQQCAVTVAVAIMAVPWQIALDMLPTVFGGDKGGTLAASAWELGGLLTKDVQATLFPTEDADGEISEDDDE